MNASASRVRRMISAGWASMRAGNSLSALGEFRSALAAAPENVDALVGLCQSYLDAGELKQAGQQSDELLRLAPELASAHRLKAEVHRRRRNRSEALEYARRAVQLEPEEPVGYHILALIHYDRKDYRAALKMVEWGRAIAPGCAILAAQQALILLQMKGGKAAEPAAKQALQLDMDDDYVLAGVARVALARGQLDRARDLLSTVLRHNANDEDAISLYLLSDPGRYGLLRSQFQFPSWRKENGALGWLAWFGV